MVYNLCFSPSISSMDYQPYRRRRVVMTISEGISNLKSYLLQYKKGILIAIIAIALFNWYELRPIRVNRICAAQSSSDARALLQSKAKVATDAEKRTAYQNLVDQNLYLRTDYESFFKKCMRNQGFNNV